MHRTRASRYRRVFWQRLAIWIFIGFFALSVAGGLFILRSK
jgi:hypothetical protein